MHVQLFTDLPFDLLRVQNPVSEKYTFYQLNEVTEKLMKIIEKLTLFLLSVKLNIFFTIKCVI